MGKVVYSLRTAVYNNYMLATLESTIMLISATVNRSISYVDYALVYALPVVLGSVWIWRGVADGVKGVRQLGRWVATHRA